MPESLVKIWLTEEYQTILRQCSRDEAAYDQIVGIIQRIISAQPAPPYKAVLDEHTDLICRYLPDMRMIYANPAYVSFFDQDPDTIVGISLLEIIKPESHSLITSQVAQILATSQPLRSVNLIRKDDEHHWYEWINSPVFDDTGKIVAIQGVGRDVTERQQVEDALRESESRFRQIAEYVEEVFYIFDPKERRVLYVSPAYERVWMHPVNEIYDNSRAFTESVHPDDRQRLLDALDHESPSKMLNERYRIIRPDGTIRHIWSRNFAIYADGDEPERVVGIAADVTIQTEMQQRELDLAIEQERTRLLSNFIRDASHEFKTPLSIMSTSIYLAEHTPSETQRQHHHRKIKDQVHRLTRLIEALITMSRLDNDTSFQYRALDINRVLLQHMRFLEMDFEEKNVRNHLILDRTLPRLMIDERELFVALQHIFSNALRFSPSGATLTIKTSRNGRYCRILIEDEGPGIAPEHLPHIFDRFYRADQARSTEGFGLGLSISRRIVELHNGHIDVVSNPGEGSCFIIDLPLKQVLLDSDVR